ncbi:MAG: VOC family protein [Acidimicrobiales bacterium]
MADPPSPAPRAGDGEVLGSLEGLHGVRIPVTDALVSKDWYMTVLGLEPVLDLEEEQGVVGVVLRHPTGFVIGLHQEPHRAGALRGFAVIGLTVTDRVQLERWRDELQRLGRAHGPLEAGHLGWFMDVPDPDGVVVRFHTGRPTSPDAEEA